MSTTLQDATDARKAKLQALRAQRDKKRKATDGGEGPEMEAGTSIGHRNFDDSKGAARAHDHAELEDTVESQVEGVAADIVKQDAARRKQELDLFNIQPKKPNWDLKRDVEKKMTKLDYQTKSAIAQLIRQRIANEKSKNASASKESTEADAALAGGHANLAKALEQRTAEELSDAEDD